MTTAPPATVQAAPVRTPTPSTTSARPGGDGVSRSTVRATPPAPDASKSGGAGQRPGAAAPDPNATSPAPAPGTSAPPIPKIDLGGDTQYIVKCDVQPVGQS